MPRTCTVCNHAKRAAINRDLIAGRSVRDIAGQFQLSSSAVDRHKRDHLPATILKAKESREIAEGASLLGQLRGLGDDTRAVLDAARTFADAPKGERCADCVAGPQMALRAIARLERQLELQARIAGALRDGPAPPAADAGEQIAAWLRIREVIARALSPFPDAAAAVAAALADFELDPGDDSGVGADHSPGVS